MLGIHDDGSFYDFAYDSKYVKSVDNDGVIFKGKGIDNIEVIKSFIEDLHVKHLPHMSFIGWDILAAFSAGIGHLLLCPYVEAAGASFYRELKANK